MSQLFSCLYLTCLHQICSCYAIVQLGQSKTVVKPEILTLSVWPHNLIRHSHVFYLACLSQILIEFLFFLLLMGWRTGGVNLEILTVYVRLSVCIEPSLIDIPIPTTLKFDLTCSIFMFRSHMLSSILFFFLQLMGQSKRALRILRYLLSLSSPKT